MLNAALARTVFIRAEEVAGRPGSDWSAGVLGQGLVLATTLQCLTDEVSPAVTSGERWQQSARISGRHQLGCRPTCSTLPYLSTISLNVDPCMVFAIILLEIRIFHETEPTTFYSNVWVTWFAPSTCRPVRLVLELLLDSHAGRAGRRARKLSASLVILGPYRYGTVIGKWFCFTGWRCQRK